MRQHEIFEEFRPFEGALVFDDWSEFIAKCNTIQQPMPPEQACEIVGINYGFFNKVVDHAFASWRESTSQSILHGISYLRLGQIPQQGKAVFKDLLWQTRFLTKCRDLSPIFLASSIPIKKDGQFVIIRNSKALTVTESGTLSANKVLRGLYLYWWMNSIQRVKLPKRIYRGIRAGDLMNHESLKPAISAIFAVDKTHQMKRKEAIDFLIKWICDKKLHQITDGNVLSFTASIPVAKYFTKGEGFILAVDPSKVEIVTSELHDERLRGKDYMSKKQEKEYIIRIPPNYDFKPEDIIISDLDYLVAEQNPLAVGYFDHDDKEAHYMMNDLPVVAWYSWRSNTSGGLNFRVNSNFGSRQEFLKQGFDPLPTKQNLNQITDFAIKPRKRW